ncbi:uncharacterized protein PADG_02481 [Paracoccidioides brasiliensis Pb18]|uniref:Uncharacterized protein n=1 Tax=Paracoccidioides brasiliensis (strain Pb18) TaxID=502780 RepID=C1G5M6_PARBD|nr:uncharacterized protein PADG_02481 [Paracoccidioides brasiliensis Pb18]EEH46383.2 hypothetical protein PADG_02481 [Paracoccidioides brasiliensis Pb18]ODH52546.1 hypothetical protein GX48_01326 [Paracoccidioides brasiliensis]
MTNMDISTVVTSILAAFGNGRDLFKNMQKKQQLKRRGTDKAKRDQKTHGIRNKKRRNTNNVAVTVRNEDIDDVRIEASLERGPAEIRGEYEKSVRQLGERFRKGDELAQGSLAHTLLILNAGLMKLIASCLSNDAPGRNSGGAVDRRSLLTLSDSAAVDAIRALDELRQRLLNLSTPAPNPVLTPLTQKGRQRSRSVSRQRSNTVLEKKPGDKNRSQSATRSGAGARGQENIGGTSPKPPTRTETSNQTFRGMWVRSKKGSSISLATTAVLSQHPAQQAPKKLTNMIKQCEMEHNQDHPAFVHLQQPAQQPNADLAFPQYGRSEPRGPAPPIRPTMLHCRRTLGSTASGVLQKEMQPLSPLVPLSQNLQLPHGRTATRAGPVVSSSSSISSGSTKLGEIPNRRQLAQPTSLLQPQNSRTMGPVVEVGYQRPRVTLTAGVNYWRKLAADANAREGSNARR